MDKSFEKRLTNLNTFYNLHKKLNQIVEHFLLALLTWDIRQRVQKVQMFFFQYIRLNFLVYVFAKTCFLYDIN